MLAPLATLELFATKGIEYLIVIGYLALLVPVWLMLTRPRAVAQVKAAGRRAAQWALDWFRVPEGVLFHRGHTWAVPDKTSVEGRLVRVGLDDFAHALVGTPSRVVLPAPGQLLRQGEVGWKLDFDGRLVDMLSPITGRVVEVNTAVLESPDALRDPYGAGWLARVSVPARGSGLKNLLSGALARAWMEQTVTALRRRMSGDLEMAMQDGGAPVEGFVRHLSADQWAAVAAEFFMTADAGRDAPVES
jgi:glycine cleavage system H protein